MERWNYNTSLPFICTIVYSLKAYKLTYTRRNYNMKMVQKEVLLITPN